MSETKKPQIPEFKTIAEEAAFWDTHDTTDFEDEFEEIEVEFEAPLLKRGLTIMLDEPYLSQLKEAAERQHRPAATLAREWLIERLEVTKA
jgi:hypothetical protein